MKQNILLMTSLMSALLVAGFGCEQKKSAELTYTAPLVTSTDWTPYGTEPSSSAGTTTPTVVESKYGSGECEFQPELGGEADLALTQNHQVLPSHFQKKYDRNWLLATSKTSGPETARVVETTGVQLYKVSIGNSPCTYFRNLNSPPTGLRTKWDEVAEVKNDGTSSILGLYLGVGDTQDTATMPAILVLESSDRYTLVHEFMHRNFDAHDEARVNNGKDQMIAKLMAITGKLSELEKDYLRKKSDEAAKALGNANLEMTKLYDDLTTRYMLEEVTIESILGKDYESGILANVSSKAYINGGYYIQYSAEQYRKIMAPLRTEIRNLPAIATTRGHTKILEAARDQAEALLSSRQLEVQKLADEAAWRLALPIRHGLGDLNGDLNGDGVLTPEVCHHSDEIAKILAENSKRFKAQY